MVTWLLLTFLVCLQNQLCLQSSIIHSIIPYVLRVQIIEKYDWLNKNEWLLLPATFTAKFGLVFVLTLENAFSQRFHFKVNKKSIGSSKKWH